jgi:hypothetical protein
MFDFGDCHDEPIPIKVRGKVYMLPRALNAALIEWSAVLRQEARDGATAHLLHEDDKDPEMVKAGREAKARFLTYWPAPSYDVSDLLRRAVTPEGIDFFVERQCRKAGMPEEHIDALFIAADPGDLRKLADELTTSAQIVNSNKVKGEDGASPLTQPRRESEGSRGTGEGTSASSHTPTEGSTSDSSPSENTSTSSTLQDRDGSPRKSESDSPKELSATT